MQVTPATIVSDKHVVFTGPIQTALTLDDGTVVDVSPAFVEVETAEHAAELAEKIGLHYEENGHPDVPEGFKYVSPEKAAAQVERSTRKLQED